MVSPSGKWVALLALLVLPVCAIAQRAKPLPSLAFTNTLDNYEPAADAASAETFVWSNGAIRYHHAGNYQVAQWCPKLNALLLTGDGSIYTWKPGTASPVLLIDLTKFTKDFVSWPTVSLSPDARTLAVYDNEDVPERDIRLWLVDLPTQKFSLIVDDNVLKKAGVVDTEGLQGFTGVAWSPDGSKLAFGCHGPTWPEGTDGSGPAQCMVWSKSGKCKSVGIGAPVAWMDDKTILCGGQIFMDEEYVAPEIFRLGSRRMQIRSIKGNFLAYADGYVILAKNNRQFVVMDSHLKVIGHMRIPQFNKNQSRSNIPERHLVAIPSP